MSSFRVLPQLVSPKGTGKKVTCAARLWGGIACLLFMGRLAAAAPIADGSEFKVHDRYSGDQQYAATAMNGDGAFVVVWQSPNTGAGVDIMANLYDNTGASVTGERRITSDTTDEVIPDVAMDEDGNYVIVWVAPDSDGTGIFAKMYDSTGSLVVDTFQVNTGWYCGQTWPAVAMAPDGRFVIVWETAHSDFTYDIAGRRFLANGAPKDPVDFMANASGDDGNQYRPRVAIADDASFVVAWEGAGTGDSEGVFARRFTWSGFAEGDPFLVNTTTANDQHLPDVAVSEMGDFIVTWTSDNQDGDDRGVYAQRFSRTGAARAEEFLVNTTTAGLQDLSRASMNAAGDFVIAWEADGQDGSYYGIYLQAYTNLGEPIGSETEVNTYTSSYQWVPDVACNDTTGFVVTWQSTLQDTSGEGVYAQRYVCELDAEVPEYQANTYTTHNQDAPAAAMDSDGDYVIVWQSYNQDASGYGIYGQRYDSDGNAQGSEFQVHTHTLYDQEAPAVAMDADGDFVVVWYRWNDAGIDQDVYGQRFNNAGVAQGAEFLVNTYTTSTQREPDVALDADGNFVVVWQSSGQDGDNYGVYGQRYASDGTPLGTEFQISTYTTSYQSNPYVAMTPGGDFVVAWSSYGQDGDRTGTYGQRFDSGGTPQGAEFQVNTVTSDYQSVQDVAMDNAGNFIVVYTHNNDVYMRRYDSDGTPLTSDVLVNTYRSSYQNYASIAMDADGDYAITWRSRYQDGDDYGIFAQRYTEDGVVQGGEFQVNEYTDDWQLAPTIAMDDYSNFVIAWASYAQDGDAAGIFAKLYKPNPNYISEGDSQAPTATVTASTSSPTNSDTVSFDVQFDEDVQNFDAAADLDITETGTVAHTGATVTATDAQNYTVDVTGVSGDGDLTVAVSTSSDVEDLAGNPLASSTDDTVTLDNSAPTAPTVAGTTPTTDDTPTWSWTAGGGGNGTFQYQLDSEAGAWTETTDTDWTPGSALSDGTHTLYVQERDDAENWSDSGSFAIDVDTEAPNAPTVNGTIVTNDTTPLWGWSTGGGGNGTFRHQLDSEAGAWTETTDNTWTPASALSDGSHILYVQERDDAGNWSSSGSFATEVDTQAPDAPAVTGTTPTNDDTPTWNWTAGGGGNGTFRYQLDSEAGAWTETTDNTWTPGSALSDGAHTLYVQERDDAGNWSDSGSFEITIDTQAPDAPVVTGTTPTNDDTPAWSWVAGGGGNGTFRHQLDGEAGAWTETTGTDWTPGSALGDGAHTLYVQERDDAENWSDSGSHAIEVDTAAPDVSSCTCADPTPTSADTVHFTVVFDEPVTGVDATDFSVTLSGASITDVSGSGDTYTVTVATGTENGALGLPLTDDDSIVDLAGNPLGGVGAGNGDYAAGETYEVVNNGLSLAWWPVLLALLVLGTVLLDLRRKRFGT